MDNKIQTYIEAYCICAYYSKTNELNNMWALPPKWNGYYASTPIKINRDITGELPPNWFGHYVITSTITRAFSLKWVSILQDNFHQNEMNIPPKWEFLSKKNITWALSPKWVEILQEKSTKINVTTPTKLRWTLREHSHQNETNITWENSHQNELDIIKALPPKCVWFYKSTSTSMR